MDPQIVAAYVIAGGAVLAAIVTGISSYISSKKAKNHAIDLEGAINQEFVGADSSAYRIEHLVKTLKLKSDGSGEQM